MESLNLTDNKFRLSLGALGGAAGIGFAIYNKTGFWKGAGYWLLFGMIGGATGFAIDTLTKKQ